MKLTELGQFGMIDMIAEMIEKQRDSQSDSWRNVIAGVGDDCAIWKGDSSNQYAKVDCQVEGIHFNLDLISWEDLGWKALAVNLSDIAAMGGIPRYALVSLGLPPGTDVNNVVSLYNGLLKLAATSGTAVVGGNLSGSPLIFVDVNVIGKCGNPEGKYLSRYAAGSGDLIAVTGWLGSAAAGLEILRRKTPSDPTDECLRQAFARPEPRLNEGRLLVKYGVKAGMDISDGLLSDLGHICKASRVGAVVHLDQLPIRPETQSRFGSNAIELALSGGEDYQLLFTAKSDIVKEVQMNSNYPITVIGEINGSKEPSVRVVDQNGLDYHPFNTGWDHFARKK
jgi:thiamine-monophosphate kinase